MKIDAQELEVNGVKYVPKTSQVATQAPGPVKIVILQRGNGYGYGW